MRDALNLIIYDEALKVKDIPRDWKWDSKIREARFDFKKKDTEYQTKIIFKKTYFQRPLKNNAFQVEFDTYDMSGKRPKKVGISDRRGISNEIFSRLFDIISEFIDHRDPSFVAVVPATDKHGRVYVMFFEKYRKLIKELGYKYKELGKGLMAFYKESAFEDMLQQLGISKSKLKIYERVARGEHRELLQRLMANRERALGRAQ